jgi:glutaredoxin
MRIVIFVANIVWAIGLLASSGTAGEIYQWTDQNGVKHFSHIPPPITQENIKITDEIPSTQTFSPIRKQNAQNPSSNTKKQPKAVSAPQKKNKNNTVELFTTAWCGYCKKARQFLIDHNIPFKEYDIEKDKSAAERKKKLSGRTGVPYAIINGKGIYGFSKDKYTRVLGLK